jgi:uracil phosphoribosyltransferase
MSVHREFKNLFIVDHPLVQNKLSEMRDVARPLFGFRMLLKEIALLIGYELTRDLPMTTRDVTTPLATFAAPILAGEAPTIIPILRAGLGMADGLEVLMPTARIGHIGMYRDHETKRPVEYLVKIPDDHGQLFLVVDPMIATGHSLIHAVDILKKRGIPAARIRIMALVTAPEGLRTFFKAHPDVAIYAAALDECLNENAYIVPGLGDAGDRLYGTA